MMIGGVPVPLQSQVVSFAAVRPELYNFLPYTASDTGTTSYIPGRGLSFINNDPYPGSTAIDGVISLYTPLILIMTFAAPVFLNRLQYHPGQYNGSFNAPKQFTIYRGSTTDNPLYTFDYGGGYNASQPFEYQAYELFGNAEFDTPSSVFRVDFTNPDNLVSIIEVQAFGAFA